MNPSKTITPLLWRVIVFACLFIIISGVLGVQIISGGILFRDGFMLYGGIGKAAIFALIAFVLLTRHTVLSLKLQAWHPAYLSWILASLGACILAWLSINSLLAGERTLSIMITAHGSLVLSIIFAAIGCIGLKNIWIVWQRYSREIVGSIILALFFYLFLIVVYALWQPLASVVLFSVSWLLHLTGLIATIVPPHTLLFDKFGITIAQYCSGIESIALFTGLYAIVGLLDWKRFHKRRYFALFPLALVVLFGLNILRVYSLILAGYYINPDIAFSLFHTYAGLIFFVLYSAVFWVIMYKHLLIKNEGAHNKTHEK